METKKPYLSKTLWINGIIGLCAFVAMFLPAASAVPVFIAANGPAIGTAWAVLNMIVRFFTKDKVSLTD